MKRAHLLGIQGKIRFQGYAKTTGISGHASLSKSRGNYELNAEITPATAAGERELDKMTKKYLWRKRRGNVQEQGFCHMTGVTSGRKEKV